MEFRNLSLCVLLMLLVGLSFVPSLVCAEDLKEYFPLNEGNIWNYERNKEGRGVSEDNRVLLRKAKIDGTEDISGVETKRIVFVDDAEFECLHWDEEGLRLYQRYERRGEQFGFTLYKPPIMIVPADLDTPGEYSVLIEDYDEENNLVAGGALKVKAAINFDGKEDVVVSAGEFKDCLKVSRSITFQEEGGDLCVNKNSSWFAKGVGLVKWTEKDIVYNSKDNTSSTYTETSQLTGAVVNGITYGE